MTMPRPQEIYRHFKGRYYMVVTIAEKEDTGEQLVIYRALYGSYKVYARALRSFMEELNPDLYPEVGQKHRFEPVSEEELLQKQSEVEKNIALRAQTPIRSGSSGGFFSGILHKQEKKAAEQEKISPEEAENKETSEVLPAAGEKTSAPAESGKDAEPAGVQEDPNPLIEEFLDADSAAVRLELLEKLHSTITDDQIDMLSMAAGCEIRKGEKEERYQDLRGCLMTINKYEQRRERLRHE